MKYASLYCDDTAIDSIIVRLHGQPLLNKSAGHSVSKYDRIACLMWNSSDQHYPSSTIMYCDDTSAFLLQSGII